MAAACLTIMSLSLLPYCRGQLRVKTCTNIIWTLQNLIPFLSEIFVAKFSDLFLNFRSNEKVNYLKNLRSYQCAVLKKKMFLLCQTLQTAHGNFLILCQIVLHPNINFLISKQNKATKTNPKMLKQQAGIAILRHVLSFTQTELYNQI